MSKFKIRTGLIKKITILSVIYLLVAEPTNALVGYHSMMDIFDQSEFMVTGTISESTLIGDPETYYICGKLLTIKNPTIHWRDRQKREQPESMKVAYFDIGNTQMNNVGESVMIVGRTLKLLSANKASDHSEPFSPRNPYIVTKRPSTGEDLLIDCSGLYPEGIKYEAQIKFDITTYQIRSGEEINISFDVVPIRSERLGLLHHPSFSKGFRGQAMADGEMFFCLTKKACRHELNKIRATVENNMFNNFLFSIYPLYKYLIEVDAVLEAYDTDRPPNLNTTPPDK